MVRVFISMDVEDQNVARRMNEIQRRMSETKADLKFVDTKNLHLTLFFIGEVNESMVRSISENLSGVEGDPIDIELRGLGAFPDTSRPRVIFVRVGKGAGELIDIARWVSEAMSRMGFRGDEKFSPHLTVARVRSNTNIDKLSSFIKNNWDVLVGESRTSRLRLKKSTLTPKGPIYETLWEKIH